MSVLSIAEGDLFVIRVFKHLATNPDNVWANSYEFRALEAAGAVELGVLGDAVAAFEAVFHKDTVIFDRWVGSTWEDDHVPYDPESFMVTPLTLAGSVGPVGDQLPLNQVLKVDRVAASGRSGRLFYRACLNEADTSAPAGKLIINDLAAQDTIIGGALTSSDLAGYLGSGASGFQMVMINKSGSQVRTVRDLRATGATTLPTDHAWYNRTSGTPI